MNRTSLILISLFIGCTAAEQSSRDDASASKNDQTKKNQPDKRPLVYYESTIRPSDFDREVDEVQRVHIEQKETDQLVIPRDSLVLQEEVEMGFRIQILSSSSIDDANVSKLAAQQLFFADSIYVVYDPPVYKVRVGDYGSRLDANGKLSEVQEKGYPDAWVVPDKVIKRRWISVARPEEVQEEE